MKEILVDPPQGWKYGFPKYYTPTEDEPLPSREWFIKNHYPGWLFDQHDGRYRIIGY